MTPSRAIAADVSPPQLLDWTLTNTVGSNALNDMTFSVTFILSDESEIQEPKLLLKSLSSSQMTSFANVKIKSKSGNLVSYEASATIKVGQTPREWEWILYPLSDNLANSNSKFGVDSKWKTKVIVFDKTFTQDVWICESGVRRFNEALLQFLQFDRSNPGNESITLFKLKNEIPDAVINVEKCEIELATISRRYNVQTADAMFAFLQDMQNKAAETRLAQETSKAIQDLIQKTKSRINDLGLLKRSLSEIQVKQYVLPLSQEFESYLKDLNAYASGSSSVLSLQTRFVNLETKYMKLKGLIPSKVTIVCIKGKISKKVTGIAPKCPKGYTKK